MAISIITVAVWTAASAQVLDDLTELQNTISRVMLSKVQNSVEAEIVTGSGTTNHVEGLYHQATSLITGESIAVERIGAAISSMSTSGYSVDLILLKPVDWLAISLSKDSQGRYLFGSPTSPAPPVLFNTRVVTSPSIPLGHALVGDSTQTNVLDCMQPTVFISRDHLDYRTRNLVLILVETRVGFELYDRAAFRKLDISGADSESG